MASYSVVLKTSAAKELERVSTRKLRQRITARLRQLIHDPRPPGVEKLSGQERYRVRSGDYRIVYSIDDRGGKVVVFKIGHRKDVYR